MFSLIRVELARPIGGCFFGQAAREVFEIVAVGGGGDGGGGLGGGGDGGGGEGGGGDGGGDGGGGEGGGDGGRFA